MKTNKNDDQTCDVLIVGSGAAAMVAANQAHDQNLNVIVIEKSAQYGGTSAMSGGGIWIPNHPDIAHRDNPDQALTYLKACTEGKTPEEKLRAFIESAPKMLAYVRKLGVPYEHFDFYPDYYEHLPGATTGRTLLPAKMVDGSILGDDFLRLRDQQPHDFKLFGRVSMLAFEAGALALRMPKWRSILFKSLWRSEGKDPEFGRGESEYDKFSGDPFQSPTPSLGTVAHAPFYAVRVDLGDLGTKGGPRVDENVRVLRADNSPIEGLYAVGNCASPMSAHSYPGAGATLGPAMTFAYRAAKDLARCKQSALLRDPESVP